MLFCAWDIETCPLPPDTLSAEQLARREKEARRIAERERRSVEECLSKAAGLHPHLGWICCISAISAVDDAHPNAGRSWTAATPNDEADLLHRFWHDLSKMPRRGQIVWVTFNGKRFDVPFVLSRSLHHRLTPTRSDILDTYPFKQRPHADLMNLYPQSYGLADLCDHLRRALSQEQPDGRWRSASRSRWAHRRRGTILRR